MSLLNRKLDLLYVIYFIFHVIITLAIDATIAVPSKYLFNFQRQLAALHQTMNNDVLVAARPAWLQAFVWVELLFQTPFFLLAAYGLARDKKKTYIWILIYCVEAAITTFGCLAELFFIQGLTEPQRQNLLLVYAPTCIIPIAMGFDFYRRVVKWIPEGKVKTA